MASNAFLQIVHAQESSVVKKNSWFLLVFPYFSDVFDINQNQNKNVCATVTMTKFFPAGGQLSVAIL